ncbi:hypothetical protein GpartN1_g5900.t1 [Galdieria partita]|uniref:Uncharacterized protein n=1 Tax=Galdieria partita TaxID=83374 RepID=A0A9C7USF4_9RHOD|nr:hypothetical protein GpartN1_g5900.t1 [Galdieria partita]
MNLGIHRTKQLRWNIFLLALCFFHLPLIGYCKVVVELFDTLSGNWQLQITQIGNNKNSESFPLQSCSSPCVRQLYLTPTTRSDEIILQGSYLEMDEIVTHSLSLEFVGFPHNHSFRIIQDTLTTNKEHSFIVSKSDDREAFYVISDSFFHVSSNLSSSCMGAVLKDSMFWSCGSQQGWMIFGERMEEQDKKEEEDIFHKYLPTVMIIIVFILVRKLQSFLLSKRATLVPTSYGGAS